MDNLQFTPIFNITKLNDYVISVPKIPSNLEVDTGVYLWYYKNKVVKVGIFGEGVSSNSYTRYSTYRSVGKNLYGYLHEGKRWNGSVVPMKLLNENLEIGEEVKVYFAQTPSGTTWKDGLPYKVDLYILEEYYKNLYKETLWLT